jgi:TPR repeat protein
MKNDESTNKSVEFNINKHIAFKYFSMASLQRETEDEANLKLGDFYYYGVACEQNFEKAVELYKLVVSQSKATDLRSHAMLNLGMMHHFGLGTEVDLDMAQIYYDKAMKEETGSSTYMTPVYLLNLYSKW